MHERFYWLHAPKESFSERGEIVVSIDAQKMVIETMECSTLTLRLNDHLVDLDREVTILRKGQKLFFGQTRAAPGNHDSVAYGPGRSIVSVFCLLDGNEPLKESGQGAGTLRDSLKPLEKRSDVTLFCLDYGLHPPFDCLCSILL